MRGVAATEAALEQFGKVDDIGALLLHQIHQALGHMFALHSSNAMGFANSPYVFRLRHEAKVYLGESAVACPADDQGSH